MVHSNTYQKKLITAILATKLTEKIEDFCYSCRPWEASDLNNKAIVIIVLRHLAAVSTTPVGKKSQIKK